ncbi:MAG: hypothetical protein KDD33_12530, partial [Bdellovibrionales bacterium]|nr:hypothetical protein [Bdellovibrionales bacterium]
MSMSKKDRQMQILKGKAQQRELLRDYLKGGHRHPVHRREFLASGLLSMAGALLVPTIPSLIATSAHAQEVGCTDTSGGSDLPIFIHLQLSGGAALWANAVPCMKNGDRFGKYGKLGLGAGPLINNLFANNAPIWGTSSTSAGSPIFNRFLEVINGASDQDILSNTAFVAVSAESSDDNRNNPQEVSGLLALAGLTGKQLPFLKANGESNFKPAIIDSQNMLRADNPQALQDSLQFSGALGTFSGNLTQQSKIHKILAQAIEDLNKYQVEQMARTPNSHSSQRIFRQLIECASEKNTSLQGQSVEMDIYSATDSTDLAAVWAKNESGFNAQLGNMAHAVGACVRGFSPGAIIFLGGYDYHLGRTRAQANDKDREVGSTLARLLQSA